MLADLIAEFRAMREYDGVAVRQLLHLTVKAP